MPDVIVAGHICLDLIPEITRGGGLSPGDLVEVGQCGLSTGGAVPNVGLALVKLGANVRLLGKIGADPFGDLVRRLIESRAPGLSSGLLVEPGGGTSYSVVISPPGIDRTFLHYPGCNDNLSATDVLAELTPGCPLIHFGYPPLMARMYSNGGEELVQIFRQAKDLGFTTSLDMSLPDPTGPASRAGWEAILKTVLPYVDFFIPSEQELSFMLPGRQSSAELKSACLDMGVAVVVVKKGERGLEAASAGEARLSKVGLVKDPLNWADLRLTQPCYKTEVVGTTGSGDATIAGFLAGLLTGFSFADCLRSGSAVGSYCCQAADAVSGIPCWTTILEKMAPSPPLV